MKTINAQNINETTETEEHVSKPVILIKKATTTEEIINAAKENIKITITFGENGATREELIALLNTTTKIILNSMSCELEEGCFHYGVNTPKKTMVNFLADTIIQKTKNIYAETKTASAYLHEDRIARVLRREANFNDYRKIQTREELREFLMLLEEMDIVKLNENTGLNYPYLGKTHQAEYYEKLREKLLNHRFPKKIYCSPRVKFYVDYLLSDKVTTIEEMKKFLMNSQDLELLRNIYSYLYNLGEIHKNEDAYYNYDYTCFIVKRIKEIINDSNARPYEWKKRFRISITPEPVKTPKADGQQLLIDFSDSQEIIKSKARTKRTRIKHDYSNQLLINFDVAA